MIAISSKLRSPLKWHGGKSYLARRIIALIPPTRAFAEHFAGGMSVGLNLDPLPSHLANDVDPDLMNFWGQLQRSSRGGLLDAIRALDYSRVTFDRALDSLSRGRGLPAASRALAFLVTKRMSRGALGKEFAWSDRLRGGQPGDLNAWETMVEGLPRVVERLATIRLTCLDALESIRAADDEHGPDVVHYCDPPYLLATRTHRGAYAREMTDDQHAELLRVLRDVRGPVLLSGYRSPLYDAELAGWHRVEWSRPNDSGQGRTKGRRVECLWMKQPARRRGPGLDEATRGTILARASGRAT
jgi:DNA adenine methylase